MIAYFHGNSGHIGYRFERLLRFAREGYGLLMLEYRGYRADCRAAHGERDRVVPIRFGRALFNTAPEPKKGWFVPATGHEHLARYGSLEAAVAFIERRVGG